MDPVETVAAAPPRPTAAAHARIAAVTICAAFAVTALALSVPVFPFRAFGYRSGTTIYPAWTWLLVVAGLGAGAVAWRDSTRLRHVGGGVALVAAMQLAGTGIVARKHWNPAFGMGGAYGGGYESLPTLQALSLLLAAAAVVGGLAAGWLLWSSGAVPGEVPLAVRMVSLGAGLLVVIAMPLVVVAGPYGASDLTSWGALGLIYAGPWGAGVAASGWLSRPAALATLAAVAVSVAVAVRGPQMASLLFPSPVVPFAACLAAPLLVLVIRVAMPARSDQAAERTRPLVVATVLLSAGAVLLVAGLAYGFDPLDGRFQRRDFDCGSALLGPDERYGIDYERSAAYARCEQARADRVGPAVALLGAGVIAAGLGLASRRRALP